MSYPQFDETSVVEDNKRNNERVSLLTTRIQRIAALKEMNDRNYEKAEHDCKVYREIQTDIDRVQEVMQSTAAVVQNGFGTFIGSLVTKAIHHVFPEKKDDNFIVSFRENRGKTECQLFIVTKGGEHAHPFDCSGGGVWDVIAFALRCAVLSLERPKPSMFLVLDEPFKFLHGSESRAKALSMMKNTFDAIGIQGIVVHQDDDEDDDSVYDLRGSDVSVYNVKRVGYEKSEIKEIDR